MNPVVFASICVGIGVVVGTVGADAVLTAWLIATGRIIVKRKEYKSLIKDSKELQEMKKKQ